MCLVAHEMPGLLLRVILIARLAAVLFLLHQPTTLQLDSGP